MDVDVAIQKFQLIIGKLIVERFQECLTTVLTISNQDMKQKNFDNFVLDLNFNYVKFVQMSKNGVKNVFFDFDAKQVIHNGENVHKIEEISDLIWDVQHGIELAQTDKAELTRKD